MCISNVAVPLVTYQGGLMVNIHLLSLLNQSTSATPLHCLIILEQPIGCSQLVKYNLAQSILTRKWISRAFFLNKKPQHFHHQLWISANNISTYRFWTRCSKSTNTKELGSCVKMHVDKRQRQISDIAQTGKYSKEKGDYLNLVQAEREASISGVRQKPISFSWENARGA